MIEGVLVQELKQIADERGRVMRMVRVDDSVFEKFGEIYFSEVLPGMIKAWNRHKRMSQLFAVPVGKIRLVIYDDREMSKSRGNLKVLEIGRDNYQLVKIPPNLWYGFKCTNENSALLANCTNLPHDPQEIQRLDPFSTEIPYSWKLGHE